MQWSFLCAGVGRESINVLVQSFDLHRASFCEWFVSTPTLEALFSIEQDLKWGGAELDL